MFNLSINMLPIRQIQLCTNNNSFVRKNNYQKLPSNADMVTFGLRCSVGKCPKELLHLKIVDLNKFSKNVVEVNDIGYLAEIIKYFEPKTKKTYAIKRVWSPDKAKKQNTNPIEQMKVEAEIYKKLGKMKNVPEFYYYNGNFVKNEKSALNNYLIMSWVDGGSASKNGIVYDLDLVNPKSIGKIYNMLEKFDEAGVAHNDLWAGNILFTKKDVNIIDFNRSYSFNPHIQLKENNLDSFKTRFLNRYFSDVYQRKGEAEYLKIYKDCLKSEIDYYRAKQAFYARHNNMDGHSQYRVLENQLSAEIKNPEMMKEKAIKTVFDSDMHCSEIYTKYFEFGENEAIFHLKKALSVLNKNSDIVSREKANLIKSNIVVVSKLNEIIAGEGKNPAEKLKTTQEVLKLLANERIYNKQEHTKPYYTLFKSFCDFNLKYAEALKSGKSTAAVFEEYGELFKTRRLNEFCNKLSLN